jgi:hypothetical protein
MRYEGSLKHKEPWQRGRRGALCPPEIDAAGAQQMLTESELSDQTRYAVREGRAFCARQHAPDVWHGYPVGWVRVPERLRRKWLDEQRVRRRDIRTHWD